MKKPKVLGKVFASLVLLLSSCQSEEKKAAIFLYDANDTFISYLADEMEKDFTSADLEHEFFDASRSQTTQNEQIVSEISSDASLLLVNPVDRLSASAIIEKAAQTKTPLVFFNREPLTSDLEEGIASFPDIYYVGTDSSYEGRAQAEMAAELLLDENGLSSTYDKNGDGKIQTVLFRGEVGHQDTEQRSTSVLAALKEKGIEVDLLTSVSGNWSRSLAKNLMKENYEKYGDSIELVLCNNDDMALGVIDEMKAENVFVEGEEVPFPLFGVDGTDPAISAIREGFLSGTVKNDAEVQAIVITYIAEKLTSGEEVTEEGLGREISSTHAIYIQGQKITKETLL